MEGVTDQVIEVVGYVGAEGLNRILHKLAEAESNA